MNATPISPYRMDDELAARNRVELQGLTAEQLVQLYCIPGTGSVLNALRELIWAEFDRRGTPLPEPIRPNIFLSMRASEAHMLVDALRGELPNNDRDQAARGALADKILRALLTPSEANR